MTRPRALGASAMWRYIHARTVARVLPRMRPAVADHGAALNRFLRTTVESRRTFAVLQIGAYDGVANDSVADLLRDYAHVRAVLLEPQPQAFAALQQLWRDVPRITPIQAALATACGERPLYVIADHRKHLHPFAEQVASFSRAHVRERVQPLCVAAVRGFRDFGAGENRGLAHAYGPARAIRPGRD